jgi:hypothetical protein
MENRVIAAISGQTFLLNEVVYISNFNIDNFYIMFRNNNKPVTIKTTEEKYKSFIKTFDLI